jgi:hypothetical protein
MGGLLEVSHTDRFLWVTGRLQAAGLLPLVMGGHAVRYYGVERNTLDFDYHLSLDSAAGLEECLVRTGLFPNGPTEGPSWRRDDFRRFQIGSLSDGREEWIEFWWRNHLLPPFEQLWSRCEEVTFGPLTVRFLSLPDLIRSKETERESDWQDVALLEEILDLRRLAQARDDEGQITFMSGLRSRRGFERLLDSELARKTSLARQAVARANSMVTRAFLLPFVPDAPTAPHTPAEAWGVLGEALRRVTPGSPRHLALVEAARRLHKQAAMAADRADKERLIGSS